MKDKSLRQIVLEFLIGIILIIPLIKFKSDSTVWIIIMRLLYSFGIMLAITKIMSIAYRMISYTFRDTMLQHEKSYIILYLIFICIGIAIWNLYSNYFAKGYFVAEVIAYILFSFWFLLDINTTKCFWHIKALYLILESEIEKHKNYINTYKYNMENISNRKDELITNLTPYFQKKLFIDPLKELKKNIDFSYIDKYLQKMPSFQGEYKGIEGFLDGQKSINRFQKSIEIYLSKLADDKQWMTNEEQVYNDYISKMEKISDTIQKSGKNVNTLDELGIDSSRFQQILKGDIADAGNNRKNIKEFWKMTKKINKMRRINYGK